MGIQVRVHSHALHQVHNSLNSLSSLHTPGEVYQGMFGPWSVEPADEFEVLTYRVGLTATMAGESLSSQGSALPPPPRISCVCHFCLTL